MRVLHDPSVRTLSRRCWGVHQEAIGRYGSRHVRVSVLPPDLTGGQLRLWRTFHLWPALGFTIGALAAAALWVPIGPVAASAVGAAVWLLPFAWLWLGVQDILTRMRTAWGDGPAEDPRSDVERVERLAARMDAAIRAFRAGRISELNLRDEWAAVYEAVPAESAVAGSLVHR